MKNETKETKSLKTIAKRLQQILGTDGITYPHGKALEAAAQLQGHAGWSVARAASQSIPASAENLDKYLEFAKMVARVPLEGELEANAEGILRWYDQEQVYGALECVVELGRKLTGLPLQQSTLPNSDSFSHTVAMPASYMVDDYLLTMYAIGYPGRRLEFGFARQSDVAFFGLNVAAFETTSGDPVLLSHVFIQVSGITTFVDESDLIAYLKEIAKPVFLAYWQVKDLNAVSLRPIIDSLASFDAKLTQKACSQDVTEPADTGLFSGLLPTRNTTLVEQKALDAILPDKPCAVTAPDTGPFELRIDGQYYADAQSLNLTEALVEALGLAHAGDVKESSASKSIVGLYHSSSDEPLACFGVKHDPHTGIPLTNAGYLEKQKPAATNVLVSLSSDHGSGYDCYAMAPVGLTGTAACNIADKVIRDVKAVLVDDIDGDTYNIISARLEIIGFTMMNEFNATECWDQ